MEWIQMPLGPLQTNAYIVYREKACLIIDPGDEKNKIQQFLKRKGLRPKAILLTHAHFDHIGAADALREKYSVPLYVHQAEKKWLANPEWNGSAFFEGAEPVMAKPADHLFQTSGEISIEEFTFHVYETPGHSPGSVSFYFQEQGFVIAGDTLFQGSIGRTDLKGGQEKLLLKSICNTLMALPDSTYVLPGHDAVTTIGEERRQNPFLKK